MPSPFLSDDILLFCLLFFVPCYCSRHTPLAQPRATRPHCIRASTVPLCLCSRLPYSVFPLLTVLRCRNRGYQDFPRKALPWLTVVLSTCSVCTTGSSVALSLLPSPDCPRRMSRPWLPWADASRAVKAPCLRLSLATAGIDPPSACRKATRVDGRAPSVVLVVLLMAF